MANDLKRDLAQSFSNAPVGSTTQLCPNRSDLQLTVLAEDGSLLSGAPWQLWKTVAGAPSDPDRTGTTAGGRVMAKGLRPGTRCRVGWTPPGSPSGEAAVLDAPSSGQQLRTVWLDCDQVAEDLEAARRRLTNLGYPEDLLVADMIALFQHDYGVDVTDETRGTLDATTKAKLTSVHDDGLPR